MTKIVGQPGVCSICLCTHDRPCLVGCSWANREQTLCTACVELEQQALDKLAAFLAPIAKSLADVPQRVLDENALSDAEPRAKRYVTRELKHRLDTIRLAIREATRNPVLKPVPRKLHS